MKVTIEYEYEPSEIGHKYWAKVFRSTTAGKDFLCVKGGESFADARRKVLEYLQAVPSVDVPPHEELEI